MSSRGKARKRALDVLYQADVRGEPATVILATEQRLRTGDGQPLNPFVSVLVDGVALHSVLIDEQISQHSVGWTLDRMPAVDRAILRIGCLELLSTHGVVTLDEREMTPPAVVIAEAVRLAGELSTEESAGFVNGVLSAIERDLPPSAVLDSMDSTIG